MNYPEMYQEVWSKHTDRYQTTHHPYTFNGKPWGMEIQVVHNTLSDTWFKVTPGSGSKIEPISKEESDNLMKDGFIVLQNAQQ